MPAPGDRHADAQIVLAGIAMEQHLICAEQQHEDADALLAGNRPQPGRKRAVDGKSDRVAGMALNRRARPIIRQRQDWMNIA